MSALAEPFLTGVIASSLVVLSMSALAAQSNPSCECSKAQTPDEQTICKDSRLALLDKAVAKAFRQATERSKEQGGGESAKETLKETLSARRSCGTDRLCILDQQVIAIAEYAELGSEVPVPPWVGTYRVDLFTARSEPPTKSLPNLVGQCTITKIASISTRFGEPLNPPTEELDGSGSAVSFANEGYQVDYRYNPALGVSHIGDEALLCLVSIPENCPPPAMTAGRFTRGQISGPKLLGCSPTRTIRAAAREPLSRKNSRKRQRIRRRHRETISIDRP